MSAAERVAVPRSIARESSHVAPGMPGRIGGGSGAHRQVDCDRRCGGRFLREDTTPLSRIARRGEAPCQTGRTVNNGSNQPTVWFERVSMPCAASVGTMGRAAFKINEAMVQEFVNEINSAHRPLKLR